MKIRILGAGWYGAHLATVLLDHGHDVEVHESAGHIFAGASGANPARLHQGQHYPRSALTRKHCREHNARFLERYGHLTSAVPVNLYAVAHDSLVDFGTFRKVLGGEVDHIPVYEPAEYGLKNVEGAVLTSERHIVIREARAHFESALDGHIRLNTKPEDGNGFDLTIDCTFCARDAAGIDRYEPCLTVLLEGPTDRAVTVMDGPFPSLYPWDEEEGLCSLTSAKYTPFCRVETWQKARDLLDDIDSEYIDHRAALMFRQMTHYWPPMRENYRIVGRKLSIRAMPKSAADARLVDVVWSDEKTLRVRAGKIDAVLHAEKLVLQELCSR